MRKLHSIRYKLLLSMLPVFLILVCVLLAIWYNALKNQAETTAIHNMESIINVSNTAFENQVKDIINVASLTTIRTSNSLSTNILNIIEQDTLTAAEIIAYRRSAKDYLISLCSFKKYLNGLMLSNFKGDSVAYGNPTPFDMIEERGWLSLIKDTSSITSSEISSDTSPKASSGTSTETSPEKPSDTSSKVFFLEPHYQTEWYANENDLVFSILKPVYDQSKHKIGFVIADINCQLFIDSFDSAHLAKSSIYIFDNTSNNVVYASKSNILNLKQSNKIARGLSSRLKGTSGDFFITINSRKYLVVYNKSSLTNWNTISIILEKDILSEFSSAAKNVLLITGILLIFMIFIIYLFSSLLTNNIVKLTNAVKKIGGDTLSLDIAIRSRDEVADLSTQFNSMLNRIKDLMTEIRRKEEEKRTAEIAALQFQMNPHFLYNSLNTIKFLASIQGIDNIERVAELLSSLMHTNMDGRTFLSIEEDILFTKSYLSIQTYRHTNIFEYHFTAAPEILSLRIPKLFVQPLVENSIKHGIFSMPTGGSILVEYRAAGGILHILVEDNGKGMSRERIQEVLAKRQNSNGGHIGIYNIRERIKLYYGPDYDIKIDSVPDCYTRFEITIPIGREEIDYDKGTIGG